MKSRFTRAKGRSYKKSSYHKKTRSSTPYKSYKKPAFRNKKSTKFTKSLKHTVCINGGASTDAQNDLMLHACRLSGVIAETLEVDTKKGFIDLSQDQAIHKLVLAYLRTKHMVNNATPQVVFRGLSVSVRSQLSLTLMPLCILESYPGQGVKAFLMTSHKTYIRTLKDENGRTHWPVTLFLANSFLVKLKYYYKLSKPGLLATALASNNRDLIASAVEMQS